MTYHFTEEEKAEMWKLFKNGKVLEEVARKFECACQTIKNLLIIKIGIKEYRKVAKKHHFEQIQRVGQLPMTEKQIEHTRKMGAKWKEEHPKEHTEYGRKMGLKNIEENHPNWKGGISLLEFEKAFGIKKEEWKILAQKIRIRDGFICQYCGKKNSTSVHHILPKRIKIDNHPENLITLCRSCHRKVEVLTDKYLKENRDPIEIFYGKYSK